MDTTSFITHPGKVCRVMRLLTKNQRKVRNILEVRGSSPFLSTTVLVLVPLVAQSGRALDLNPKVASSNLARGTRHFNEMALRYRIQ